MWQPYDPRDSGIVALEKWLRKHYRFEIVNGGNFDTCTATVVKLRGGTRKVEVDYSELVRWSPDESHGDDYFPTVDDLLKEAIRRWHADTTVKRFSATVKYRTDPMPVWESGTAIMLYDTVSESEVAAAVYAEFGEAASIHAMREYFTRGEG